MLGQWGAAPSCQDTTVLMSAPSSPSGRNFLSIISKYRSEIKVTRFTSLSSKSYSQPKQSSFAKIRAHWTTQCFLLNLWSVAAGSVGMFRGLLRCQKPHVSFVATFNVQVAAVIQQRGAWIEHIIKYWKKYSKTWLILKWLGQKNSTGSRIPLTKNHEKILVFVQVIAKEKWVHFCGPPCISNFVYNLYIIWNKIKRTHFVTIFFI